MSESPFPTFWWQREDLSYQEGDLKLLGQSIEAIARSAGGPTYLYSAERLGENFNRLRAALDGIPPPSRILYAMKSNRYLPVLTELRHRGIDGIDVCSPAELRLARQAGFREEQISFTGTSVSNSDLDILAQHPGIWINCDSISTLRRLGERCPGRKIGLRVNTQAGVGYRQNQQLRYSGKNITKFGIYMDHMEEALDVASRYHLQIAGLHFHSGCGFLNDQLVNVRKVLESALRFADMVEGLEHLNLGGGLGIPLVEDDDPLDLAAWSNVVADTLQGRDVAIWVEPGDYLVKDTGVLVLEVNTVEVKKGRRFVGVNGGFNIHIEPAFYKLPLHPVLCKFREDEVSDDDDGACVIAGNINEALDIFAESAFLRGVREGDYIAFLNAGGYGSAMSSNHCMRGQFCEYLITGNHR